MRGKGGTVLSRVRCDRITPAYAGKRFSNKSRSLPHQDHPRLCGEKLPQQPRFCWAAGSPPPMRGQDAFILFSIGSNRITPAYAGKSVIVIFFFLRFQDHPRLCGEKSFILTPSFVLLGSPPPMRGKACFCGAYSHTSRITPAYAGKSCLAYEIRSTS